METARILLWIVGVMILLMAVAKLSIPAARDNPAVINTQLFLFGSFMSIAVWRTIVGFGQEKRLRSKNGEGQGPWLLPPEQVYASQKIAAMIMSMVILALLSVTIYFGRFAEFAGWLLLPITAIGPALYMRD